MINQSSAISDDMLAEANKALVSIQDWIRWIGCQLSSADIYFGHGMDNPWDEAVFLVQHILHIPSDLPEHLYSCAVTEQEKAALSNAILQRINQRKPLAYITKCANFCGESFYVDERVLIPRSPIAELIQNQFVDFIDPDQVHSILDLCTGSGCIAIASALQFPDAFVCASDISEEALEVAQINMEFHQLEDQMCLLKSDGFKQIPAQKFDLILSNPPYVDSQDMSELPQEFRNEPELGLASGEDGLDLTRHILQYASEYLTEEGVLIVEVGNSWLALERAYPNLDFFWIDFERGGHGVFALTRKQLIEAGL